MKKSKLLITTLFSLALAGTAFGATVVGIDFENGSGGFSQEPDDLDLTDGITVSTITTGTGGAPAGFANDNGANSDVAFEGNFVARFESSTTPSFFDITIDNTETFNFESVSFAYRGATGGFSSREIILTASIGGGSAITLYDVDNSGNTLPGRTAQVRCGSIRNGQTKECLRA